MKRLLLLFTLAIFAYFGYQYYIGTRLNSASSSVPDRIIVNQKTADAKELFSVLGTTTTSLFNQGRELLNEATDGQAEPVINQAVSDLQERVKELPAEQYQKVKAEFCKDILPSSSPEASR